MSCRGAGTSALSAGGGGNSITSNAVTPLSLSNDAEIVNFELNEFSDWKNGLTPDELKAVQQYGYDSTVLNAYLRGEGQAPKGVDVEKWVQNLDGAASHPLSQPMTVFRGVGKGYLGIDVTNEDAVKQLIGKTITDSAYMSTSISQEVGETYGRGAVFKINVPKGAKCMSTDVAESTKSQLMEYLEDGDAGNMEMVFRRGSGLKITGYTKKTRSDGKPYIEIQANMV